MGGSYKVITLCGSTKFKKDFERIAFNLTLQGVIVINLAIFTHSDDLCLDETTLNRLTDMHKQKIKMSDGIYVINKGGYIGENTKKEIEYAKSLDKTIEFMEV